MNIRFHLFFILLIIFQYGYSQKISFQIIDKTNQEEISDVLVYTPQQKYLGQANERGKVNITLDSIQIDTLVLLHDLYKIKKVAISNIGKSIALDPRFELVEEVTIEVDKFPTNKKNTSYQITSISSKEIEESNAQTSAELVQKTGKVYVQKSQMGGGSPVIRGFEANRVLLVVDGIRMNNAIYRSGHLQNIITIDPNIQDRVEVVYGPNSTIYGSDALGGIIHFHTKRPKFSTDSTLFTKGLAFARYGSVNNETSVHAHLNIGKERFASLTSINLSSFGDLKAGKSKNFFYPDTTWERNHYVDRMDGKDTTLVNSDPYLQKQTSYRQLDFLQHFSLYSKDDNYRHDFSFQFSNSSNIPRYDRLIEYDGDNLKFAQWDYGPQQKLLSYYRLHIFKKSSLFNEAKLTFSYQNIEESRINRRFQSDIQRNRIENVQVGGLNADFLKRIKKHRIEYGLETYYNDVSSTAFAKNIVTNEEEALDTRYPSGNNYLWSSGAYISHKYLIGEKLHLSDGLRFSMTNLYASFADTTFFQFPFSEVQQFNTAITGNIGLKAELSKDWIASLLFSTGFRAPNIDDVGKVFDSAPGVLVVPNDDLSPEYAYNVEFSIEREWKKSFFEIAVYHTWLQNAIRVSNFQLNGDSTIIYEGEESQIIANTNTGEARVYGAYLGGRLQISKPLLVNYTISYTKGEDISENEPLGHIPPIHGSLGLKYQKKKWSIALNSLFNGKKDIDDYYLGDGGSVDRVRYAINDYGLPAWMTFNLSGQYKFGKNLLVQGAIENVLDTHYLPFASGLVGAGRNFLISVRYDF